MKEQRRDVLPTPERRHSEGGGEAAVDRNGEPSAAIPALTQLWAASS